MIGTTRTPLVLPISRRLGAFAKNRGVGPFAGELPLPVAPPLLISGVTRDNTGAALGNCIVELYRRHQDQTFGTFVERVVSDGSGNFTFSPVGSGVNYQHIAYLPGSPDRAAVSVRTVVGI